MSALTHIPRGAWPWGRTAPSRRIRDLEAARAAQLARKKIIDDQAREAHRRADLNIGEIERQIAVARTCLEEERRARNKEIAYRLQALGVEAIERVENAPDQEALGRELAGLLAAAEKDAVMAGAGVRSTADRYGGEGRASEGQESGESATSDVVDAEEAMDFFRSE